MNESSNDENNLQKASRTLRTVSGSNASKLLSKVASTVKFVVRANTGHIDTSNPKQLLRKESRQNVMRVAYIGSNGQLNNKALLVTRERLERPINFDNDEDRKLIINVMVKRPHKRADVEVTFLQKAFRDAGFFQKMESELDANSFKKLFAALQLEVCEPGHKLFNLGDIGTKFYIIIQGSVYILLRKEGIVTDPLAKQTESQLAEIEKKKAELAKFLKQDINEETKKAKVEECYPGFWIIKGLGEGEAFGELALQRTSDRRRTATIVCREKTLLGVLTFEDFRSILGAFYEKKYQEKVNFFQNMDLFQHWRGTQLACLILHMEETKLHRNNVVFKEGDRSNRLYFIKKGEIELIKKIQIPTDPELEEEMLLAEKATGKRIIKVHKKPDSMRLAILTEGDYFGESELIENKPRSYTAVTYSTEVTLISISRKNFMAFVSDHQSVESLKEHIKKKTEWREELTSKFVNLHKRVEESLYHLPGKVSQSLTNFDFSSPQSRNHPDPNRDKQFSVSNFSKSPDNETFQSTVYSKAGHKDGKGHRHTLSLTKIEQDSLHIIIKDSTPGGRNQPRVLPFIAKKGSGKFESAYQKHKRRLAQRQEKGRQGQENEGEGEGEEQITIEDQNKSQSHRVPQGTSLNSLTNLNQSGKVEKELAPQPPSKNKGLYSLLGGRLPSSKSKMELSLSGAENSLSLIDRQLSIKAYSLNTTDPTRLKLASSVNLASDRPVMPVKASRNESRNESMKQSLPCSLNDLEVTGNTIPSNGELDENKSSTVRFHNKLRKILQIRDTPESTRGYSSRSRLLDPKVCSSLNDLALSVSAKGLNPSPFNDKNAATLPSQRKGL